MSTTRWTPTRRRKRVLIGFQDQCTFKLKPWTHTDSDVDVLYMDGNIMMIHFQCYWSHFHIKPESSEIDETRQSPETVLVLRHRMGPLGLVLS
jgi:hypothetical protein